MIKKGDTLIEVALAIGIFSMIAIAIAAVLSSGTSGSQTALESSLAREEIDTQAEALRFIHTAYSVNSNETETNQFSKLWKDITAKAIDLKDTSEDAQAAILQYSPSSCDDMYNNVENNAFIINPRKLGDLNVNNSSAADSGSILSWYDSGQLNSPSIYPRLIYDNDTDNLSGAEGIYVIAVKDNSTTTVATDDEYDDFGVDSKAAFYDFYIRSCWYGTDAEEPSTISTVIRLYDPDAIEAAQFGSVSVTYNYNDNGATPNQTVTGTKIDLITPEREGWSFAGWCSGTIVGTSCSGGRVYSGQITNSDPQKTLSLTLTAIWKKEYTVKYHDGPNVTRTQTCTATPTYFSCTTKSASSFSSSAHSSDSYTLSSWCTVDTQSCPSGSSIGLSRSLSTSQFNQDNILDLYAVWKDKLFYIYYWSSTYEEATCTMSALKNSQCKVTTSKPSQTGYDLAGWCDGYTDGLNTCYGTRYQSGATISPSTTGTYLYLDALWSPKYYTFSVSTRFNGVRWSGHSFEVYQDGSYLGAYSNSFSKSVPWGTSMEVVARECTLYFCKPHCWSDQHLGEYRWIEGNTNVVVTWNCYNY